MQKTSIRLVTQSWSARILNIVLLALAGINFWFEFRVHFGVGSSQNSQQGDLFSSVIAIGFYLLPIFIAFISVQQQPISIFSHTIVWFMVCSTGYIFYMYEFVSAGPDKGVLLFFSGLISWASALFAALCSGKVLKWRA